MKTFMNILKKTGIMMMLSKPTKDGEELFLNPVIGFGYT